MRQSDQNNYCLIRSSDQSSLGRAISIILNLFILFTPVISFANANSGITYHGRILKPDGTALEGQNVQFKIQFRTPGSENCLMYEEVQSKDMQNSSGIFAVTINDGTGTREDTTGYTLDTIFANRGTLSFPSTTCVSGSGGTVTWSPNASDGRLMQVYFKDETMASWEPTPAEMINFVPMAIESKQVGGFAAANLLRVQEANGTLVSVSPLNNAQYTELVALANGTSSHYAKVSAGQGVGVPTISGAPTSVSTGSMWFDTSTNTLKYYDGTATQTLGTSGGSVTSITAGAGLTGGTITTAGTIALGASGVTAGTYPKVQVDTYGRVISGSTLSESDIPTLSTAGTVSGTAINSGTIGGSTAINTTGNIQTTGTLKGSALSATQIATQGVQVFESTNNYKIILAAPSSLANNYQLTLPPSAGASGQVLTTDGSGVLTWSSVSGVTPGGTAGGDLSGNYPSPTVAKIQGVAVSSTAPLNGQVLKYVSGSTQWQPTNFSIADLKTSIGGGQFANASCGANQTITWSSLTDSFTCTTIAISNTQVAGLGTAALKNIGTTSGTVAAGDDARIVGAVQNAGGVSIVQSGVEASRPAAGVIGLIYIATDTARIYRDTGSSWSVIATATGLGGTVTAVTAGTGLSGGTISSTGTISLANTAVTPGSYGDATHASTFTVDQQGRLTSASQALITGVTPGGSAGGDLGGTYPNPTLSSSAVTTAKIADGAVTTAKLFSNPGVGRLVATDHTDGSTLVSMSCASGQVLAWNVTTGWTCTDQSSLSVASATNFSGSLTGDVTGTQSATVVAKVGGMTAANVAAGATLANSATDANTASTIVKRDSSGNFSATQATLSKVVLNDSGSNTAALQAPTAITSSYVLKLPTTAGTSGQVLSTDGSGNLSWVAATSGSVTSVGVSAPIQSTGGATPTLSIAKATSSTDGYLSQTDWTTFNNKLGTSLASGNIWVGNAGGAAAAVAPSGDVTLSNAGAFSVNAIKGTSISATPTFTGQVLRYDGTNWTPNFVSMQDLRSNVTGSTSLATSCAASQTLTYNSVGDNLTCTNIAITNTQISGLGTAATLNVGTAANNILQLDSSAKIPAVDASQVTSINASNIASGTLNSARLPSTVVLNGGNSFGANSSIGNIDNHDLNFITNNASRITILKGGNVGIGTSAPTSLLTLAAGTATAGTAPLKLTSGTNLTTPEAGAIEYDGTSLYYTDATNTRRALASTSGSGSENFGQDVTMSGAGTGLAVTNNATVGGTLTTTGAATLNGGATIAGGALVLSSQNITGVGTNLTGAGAMTVAAGGTNQNLTLTGSGTGSVLLTPNVGIGTTAPAAKLHIAAGTTSVAPLMLTSGTNLTTPAAGAIEYDGTNLYFTDSTATRRALASTSGSSSTSFGQDVTMSGAGTGLAVTNNATVGGTLTTTGLTTMTGGFTSAGTASVTNSTASTSSSTGAFTVSGGVGVTGNIYSGGVLAAGSGTAALPSHTFGSDTASGLWSPATSAVALSTNGVERLRINSSGNIGIGTTSPSSLLNLSGVQGSSSLTMNESTYGGSVVMQARGYPTGANQLQFTGAGSQAVGFTVGSNSASVGFDGTNIALTPATGTAATIGNWNNNFYGKMSIDASASAGFTALTLKGSSGQTADYIDINSNSGSNGNVFVVKSSGNVGIGTTAPSGTLDVEGGTAAASTNGNILKLVGQTGGTVASGTNTNGGNIILMPGSAGTGGTGGTNGYVGVGTTNPQTTFETYGIIRSDRPTNNPATQWLQLNGGDGGGIYMTANSAAGAEKAMVFNNQVTGGSANSSTSFIFQIQGAEIMRLTNTGNVGIGVTAPNAALQIRAGTTTVAPLMLTSGTNLTTPLSGAIEYDGTNLYFTDSGAVRRTIASTSGASSTSFGQDVTMSGAGTGLAVTNNETVGGTLTTTGLTTMTGGFTSAGTAAVTNSTASTSTSTGALTVSGGMGVVGTVNAGTLAAGNGTAGLPSLTFTGDTASGLWSPATSAVALSTAGNERLRINSSGFVGIGTTVPTNKLTVMGSSTALFGYDSTTAAGTIILGKTPQMELIGDGTANNNPNIGLVQLNINGANTYQSSSEIYLGATRATSSATVGTAGGGAGQVGNTDVLGQVGFYGDDGTNLRTKGAMVQGWVDTTNQSVSTGAVPVRLVLATQGTAPITFNTAAGGLSGAVTAGERMRITGAGNVGIGTTAPSYKLDVEGGDIYVQNGVSNGHIYFVSNGTTPYIGSQSNQLKINYGSYNLSFLDDNGTTMALSKAGGLSVGTTFSGTAAAMGVGLFENNVGIGTTAPTAKLNIAAGTATVAPLQLTSGTNLTSPLSGAIEYDGTNLYYTDSGAVRRTIASTSGSSSTSFGQDVTMSGAGTGLAVTNNETVGGTLAVTGATTITNSTASTSTSTGALVVSGGVGVAGNIYSGGVLATSQGTAALPSHTFTADTASGMWQPASSVVAMSTAGAERMRITSAGRVGIGTTAPASALDVAGTIDLNGSTTLWQDVSNNNLIVGSTGMAGSLSQVGGGYNGQRNIAIGVNALQNDSTGNRNIAMGYFAMGAGTVTSAGNIAIGEGAYQAATTGGSNTAVGTRVLLSNSTGNNNTGLGYNSLYYSLSDNNTALGFQAGKGVSATTTATNSTFVGYQAGFGITTGNSNTTLGTQAGYDLTTGSNNTLIGQFPTTGVGVTTGSNNILIGQDVRPPSQTASNQLNVGNLIYATGLASGTTASTGLVGIGTTAPDKILTLSAGTTNIHSGLDDGGLYLTRSVDGGYAASITRGLSSSNTALTLDYEAHGGHFFRDTNGSPPTTWAIISNAANGGVSGNGGYLSVPNVAQLLTLNGASNNALTLYSDDSSGSTNGIILNRSNRTSAGNNAISVFQYNGSEVARVTTGGSVGIGTTAPAAALQIKAGTATVAPLMLTSGTNLTSPLSGAIEYDGTNLYYTDSGAVRRTIASTSGTGAESFGQDFTMSGAGTGLAVTNNATVGGTLTTTGLTTLTGGFASAGTGTVTNTTASTSSSTGALTVSGGMGVAGNIYSGGVLAAASGTAALPSHTFGSDTASGMWSPATSAVALSTNGTERVRINSSGNVGIGTTAPTTYFDVSPGTASGEIANFGNSGISGQNYISVDALRAEFGYNGATSNVAIQAGGGKGIELDVNNGTFGTGQAMVINSSAQVGIGTTSPSQALDVVSASTSLARFRTSGANNSGVIIDNLAGGNQSNVTFSDGGVAKWQIGKQTNNTFFLYDSTNARDAMRIDGSTNILLNPVAGNVGIGANSPLTTLDVTGTSRTGSVGPTTATTFGSSALTTDTTLTVASTTGYPSSGLLYLTDNNNSEVVSYTGVTATTFTGVTRALYGTTAKAWATGNTADLVVNVVAGANSTTAPRMLVTQTKGLGYGLAPAGWVGAGSTQYSGNLYTASGIQVSNAAQGISFGTSSAWVKGTGASTSADSIIFGTNSTQQMVINGTGSVGIGTTAPTALLNIKAGTTALAPLQLTAGTNLTTPLSGAIEYDGTNLYFTDSGAVRRTIASTSGGSSTSFGQDVTMSGSGTGLAVTNNATVGGTLATTGLTTMTGGFTSAGTAAVTNSTASTSSTTGALTVSGGMGVAGNIYSGGVLAAASGTAALPSHTFGSDTASGLWSPATSAVALSTAGAERMRINSSGYVGIGTTTPGYLLDVSGNIRVVGSGTFSAADNNSQMQVVNQSSTAARYPGLSIQNYTGGFGGGGGLWFRNAEGSQASPAASLNSTPLGTISFYGHNGTAFATTAGSSITATTTEAFSGSANGSDLRFSTTANGATTAGERVRIASSGNVGIGTTAPGAMLTVGSNPTYNAGSVFTVNGRSSINNGATSVMWSELSNATPDARIQTVNNGVNTGSIALEPFGGNVGIGTTSPLIKFETDTSSAGAYPIAAGSGTQTSGISRFNVAGQDIILDMGAANSTPWGFWLQAHNLANTSDFPILLNPVGGNVGIGTTSPGGLLDVNGTLINRGLASLSAGAYGSSNGITVGDPNYKIYSFSNNLYLTGTPVTGGVILQSGGGNVGIGTTAPTAKLNIAAGTATVAPLQLTSGTNLTTPLSGAIEYDGTNLYFTDSGAVRRTIASTSGGSSTSFGQDVTMGGSGTGLAITNAATVGTTLGVTGLSTLTGGFTSAGTGAVTNTTASTSSSTGALTVSGGMGVAGNIYSGGVIAAASGTAALPSHTFGGDTASGMWSPATSAVALSTAGAERMRINSSGNIGIGTTAPGALLDVASGGVAAIFGADNSALTRTDATGKTVRIGMPHYNVAQSSVALITGFDSATSNQINFGGGSSAMNAATELDFYTGASSTTATGTSRMTINYLGNVGIGTTSPGAGLDVANGGILWVRAGAVAGHKTAITTTDAVSGNLSTNYGYLSFSVDATNGATPTEDMRITQAGNVGIGTTAPNATLQVNGTITGKAAVSNGTSTVDFSLGNQQYTAASCGTFNLNNMKDGGSYAFVVQGSTSATCVFNAFSDAGSTPLTVHLPPNFGATTANYHTMFNFMVFGGHVYVAWTPGY